MDGVLVLEDGHFFRGARFGGRGDGGGEVVFNTSLTGYQEILTDPSYVGQIVTLTYPHIGNYGVNPSDVESGRVHVAGLIVRDHNPVPSNWRSSASLGQWLAEVDSPGLCGVDTRSLVGHIRRSGTLRGVIADLQDAGNLPIAGRLAANEAEVGRDRDRLAVVRDARLEALLHDVAAIPSMAGRDLAKAVTCSEISTVGPADARWHVVVLDFGAKRNIVRQLIGVGCRVTVVPASTTASEILALAPDGLMLSNGPGDPEPVAYAVATIAALIGVVPIFGICLGHQLLAIALGGRTYKLPFGHRGANHPVRDLGGSRVEITSQNHGFAVDPGSLDGQTVALTHLHLNDDTVAGLRHRRAPAFSVQFHPEASPGPHDSHHLFERFVDSMERHDRKSGRTTAN